MLRGTLANWCSSSPTSGTVRNSRSSSANDCALPCSVFIRSACATVVTSSRARSLVMCMPPTGNCAVCSNWPSANTATPVVPPPMSMTVAPMSRSSSTSVARPAAIGADTTSAMSRSQRAMQAPSVRNAEASASTMCSRAVSVEQNSPRGSATWSVVSTMNDKGSEWITSRPSDSDRSRASSTTRRMSCSTTTRPPVAALPIGHCTLNSRESGWPQDRFTVTARSRVSAMSSAWPTAARIARSASSMSTMPPARTPRPRCQPNPSTRSEPSLSVRPIRHATLVVPISSTPNGPARCARGRVGSSESDGGRRRRDISFIGPPERQMQSQRRPLPLREGVGGRGPAGQESTAIRTATPPPYPLPQGEGESHSTPHRSTRGSCRLLRRGIRRRLRPRPQHQPIGQPHINDLQRPVEQRVILLQHHQPLDRHRITTFRQHHVHAAAQLQVPPPLADPHRRHHPRQQPGMRRQSIDQRRRGARCARPDHQRQLPELPDVLVGHRLTVAIDQHELPLVLPDRERPPLDELHHDGIGQPPLDRRLLHPG